MALPPTALRQTFERILEGCSVEMRERIVRLRDGPSRNAKKRAERVVSELAASGGGREDEDALKAVELKLLLWNSPEDGLVRRWKLSAEGSTAYVRFLAANFLNADRAYKEARYHGDAAVSRACARRRALSLFDLSGLKGQDHAMGEGLNALAADAHFCTAIAQLTEMDDAALATDRPEDGEDDEVSGLLSLGGSVRMATSFGSGVGGEGGAAEGGEAAWLFGDAMCVASEAAEVLMCARPRAAAHRAARACSARARAAARARPRPCSPPVPPPPARARPPRPAAGSRSPTRRASSASGATRTWSTR